MLSAKTSDFLALCTLLALSSLFAGWVVLMLRRSPFTPVQSFLYALNYIIVRVLWRARVHRRFSLCPAPSGRLVFNPTRPLDPSFIVLAVPRVVRWVGGKEYCEFSPFRKLLHTCGAIPVARGGVGADAAKAAIRTIEEGGLVGIFPEGRINTTRELLLSGHSGAALIALKSRATVVPCYIHGAPYDGTTLGCLLMSASVRLEIGQPIDISPYFGREDDREALAELTRQFLAAIAALAGRTDFQPQVAGRSFSNGLLSRKNERST
jgi:1-acyl-sn-glycerol-3-phosphate acyltransferase